LWHDGGMRNVLPRLLAALPDAIASADAAPQEQVQ
jgi:hypothetical protein